ncbi:AAA-type ATPase lid domain-containing protein [Photobacterium angustum]
MCRELGYSYFAGFTQQAKQQLLDYQWPGNIRELKNVVERSVFRHSNEDEAIAEIYTDPFATAWQACESTPPQSLSIVDPPAVKQESSSIQLPVDLRQYLKDQEIMLINNALKQARFNQTKAAELLSLSYHQLRGLIRKYDISVNGD